VNSIGDVIATVDRKRAPSTRTNKQQ